MLNKTVAEITHSVIEDLFKEISGITKLHNELLKRMKTHTDEKIREV